MKYVSTNRYTYICKILRLYHVMWLSSIIIHNTYNIRTLDAKFRDTWLHTKVFLISSICKSCTKLSFYFIFLKACTKLSLIRRRKSLQYTTMEVKVSIRIYIMNMYVALFYLICRTTQYFCPIIIMKHMQFPCYIIHDFTYK